MYMQFATCPEKQNRKKEKEKKKKERKKKIEVIK